MRRIGWRIDGGVFLNKKDALGTHPVQGLVQLRKDFVVAWFKKTIAPNRLSFRPYLHV